MFSPWMVGCPLLVALALWSSSIKCGHLFCASLLCCCFHGNAAVLLDDFVLSGEWCAHAEGSSPQQMARPVQVDMYVCVCMCGWVRGLDRPRVRPFCLLQPSAPALTCRDFIMGAGRLPRRLGFSCMCTAWLPVVPSAPGPVPSDACRYQAAYTAGADGIQLFFFEPPGNQGAGAGQADPPPQAP